jgi:hypothetical protein
MNQQDPCNISVIGLGSLGGFIVKNLSEIDFVKEITIVDFDKVQQHNLSNSIYEEDDIGKNKTSVLYNKLIYSKKKIKTITDQYVGNNIDFSSSDIIIDCRDIMPGYDPQVTFKTFISGHYLIICNKQHENDDTIYEGRYLYPLDKDVIKYAASKVSRMISSKIIFKLLERQDTHSFEILDIEKEIYSEANKPCKPDNYIVDDDIVFKKVSNLMNVSNEIINCNKNNPVQLQTVDTSFRKHVEVGYINDLQDLTSVLRPIVNVPFAPKFYFLKPIYQHNGDIIIEIIPESGGA